MSIFVFSLKIYCKMARIMCPGVYKTLVSIIREIIINAAWRVFLFYRTIENAFTNVLQTLLFISKTRNTSLQV